RVRADRGGPARGCISQSARRRRQLQHRDQQRARLLVDGTAERRIPDVDYLLVTTEAVERLGTVSAATVTFRMEVLREYATARQAVVPQEGEVAESAIQLTSLDEFIQQLRGRLDEVERHFGRGKVTAPIAGIVSTGLAHIGNGRRAHALQRVFRPHRR